MSIKVYDMHMILYFQAELKLFYDLLTDFKHLLKFHLINEDRDFGRIYILV